jgi:DNA-binding NtrC family response regulator
LQGVFERIGGIEPIRVSVRIIATTNQDLREAIRSGRFQGRFVLPVERLLFAPSTLRERKSDIDTSSKLFSSRNPEIRFSESIISWVSLQNGPVTRESLSQRPSAP